MTHSGRNDPAIEAIERFLTNDTDPSTDIPPVHALEQSGLTAYAAPFLDGGKLRPALLAASARHLAVKAQVHRLLRAWEEAGVEALLFKGFHLAEFVYPSQGGRQYSDVDVLIDQRDVVRAANVAAREGWRETWNAQRSATAYSLRSARYRGHEVLQLLHPRAGIPLDVHRRLVHNNHNRLNRFERQERITRLTWEKSESIDWDGVTVRLPHPLDAILVGLVLNRCWSPEDFRLRSHDYLDFRFLVGSYGVTRAQLMERAEELGCPRTLELFLERCDPFRRRCVLSSPTQIELQRWNLLIAAERGNRYLERRWIAAMEWPRKVVATARHLPGVVAALNAVNRAGGVREAAESYASPIESPRAVGAEEWLRIRQGVHRGLRLVGHGNLFLRRPASAQDLEALALYAELRRRSCTAELSWSVTTAGESRPRLELDGSPLNVAGTLLSSRASRERTRRMVGRRIDRRAAG